MSLGNRFTVTMIEIRRTKFRRIRNGIRRGRRGEKEGRRGRERGRGEKNVLGASGGVARERAITSEVESSWVMVRHDISTNEGYYG